MDFLKNFKGLKERIHQTRIPINNIYVRYLVGVGYTIVPIIVGYALLKATIYMRHDPLLNEMGKRYEQSPEAKERSAFQKEKLDLILQHSDNRFEENERIHREMIKKREEERGQKAEQQQ